MAETVATHVQKIVVLNPKGGCGKTTLATNIASAYAIRGTLPTLLDFDPQGFSMRWVQQRGPNRPRIQAIAAHESSVTDFEEHLLPLSSDSKPAIFDLPAAIPHVQLHHYTHIADSILIPVMPSEIDVYTATRLIAELMLDMQLDRREKKVAIVANRVRKNTRSFQKLLRFLGSLQIPLIAVLRDSQNYVQAADEGIGVCELPAYRARHDIPQLNAVMDWLDRRGHGLGSEPASPPGATQADATIQSHRDLRPKDTSVQNR
jgi:chromosome partitioning protein